MTSTDTAKSNLLDAVEAHTSLFEVCGIRIPVRDRLAALVERPGGQELVAMIMKLGWDLQTANDSLVSQVGALTRHAAELESQVARGLRVDTAFVDSDARRVTEYAARRQATVDQIVTLVYVAEKLAA